MDLLAVWQPFDFMRRYVLKGSSRSITANPWTSSIDALY